MYINGHLCYAYKFGIITNGLGIVRDITFYNKDFLNAHPDIVVEKKSDSPDVERGSTEWDETYKIRVNVEKSISTNISGVLNR